MLFLLVKIQSLFTNKEHIQMQKHRKTKLLQNKASNKQLQAIAKRNKRKSLLGLLNFNNFTN